jgi:DnaK suppressor protein
MDEERLTEFRRLLEHHLHQALMGLGNRSTFSEDGVSTQDPMDFIDLATCHMASEFTANIQRLRAKRLEAIGAALQRLAAGDYGICEECAEEIGVARLHAQPTATVCVACQKERENTRGLHTT